MGYTIKTRITKRNGLAFDLYYRWKGKRFRPLLGYGLSEEEAERRAVALIGKIHKGSSFGLAQKVARPTLRSFLPVYWQAMRVKQRLDLRRPEDIIENHLLPRFPDRPLDSLTAEDGLAYITARLKAGAASWTIRREWNVFMRILNLAVDFDKLDKNRLKRVQLPDVDNRERVASDEELTAIHRVAPSQLRRILLVALHTGLREAKALEIGRSWVRLRDDGPWLILPPARSRLKGTPTEIPLNRIAAAALKADVPSIDDRIFTQWTNAGALGKAWQRICQRAKVQDLHFHDLRHTFATRLQNLGVSLEIRATLLGHRIRGFGGEEAITARYSHGGPGWNEQLRRAVTSLETAYPTALSYGLSYESGKALVADPVNAPNAAKNLGKGWWSQRDLNPCLSLERAPSWTKLDAGTSRAL